jgi:hypothetical protein
MEDFIWDAVPVQRKRKEEKYSFPVVTMSAIEKVGAGRKFSFNKAAQELLGVVGEDRVSFGFSPDRKIIAVRKATGDAGFQLTKTCTISDKKTYDFIAKILNLDTTYETEFSLESLNGMNVLVQMVDEKPAQEEEAIQFEVTNVGEVSDEEDLDADVSSVPTAESFGVEAGEVDVNVEEEVEDSVMPEPIYEDATEESDNQEDTEEDVW